MLIINLIDKDRVQGHEDFGDARAVWRARLFLFIGFSFMAGGLAGSVVRSPPLEKRIVQVRGSLHWHTLVDRPRAQVHPPTLRRAVYLLWICQRIPERRPYALCYRSMGFPKRQHGIRVYAFYLTCLWLLYCYLLHGGGGRYMYQWMCYLANVGLHNKRTFFLNAVPHYCALNGKRDSVRPSWKYTTGSGW